MDLRLRVNGDQRVAVPAADVDVDLRDGEEIRIEISTKFRIPAVTGEIADAGFRVRQLWTDRDGDFALILASADRALTRLGLSPRVAARRGPWRPRRRRPADRASRSRPCATPACRRRACPAARARRAARG